MIVSDGDIAAAVLDHLLRLDPFDPAMIQPASIDVRLDATFRVFNNHLYDCIDPAREQSELTSEVRADPFVLHPGEFVLGSTVERIELGDSIAGRLEGKSSLGRLGLIVHSTAGFIDPGFAGTVTLELSNVNSLPIRLYPGMKIGQLCLFATTSPVVNPYGSAGNRYQNQSGPTASRAHQNLTIYPTGSHR